MLRMLRHRIGPLEAVGLRPLKEGLAQCWRGIAGDGLTPPTRFGLSSLRIFRPVLGPATWVGFASPGGSVQVLNLFNRVPQSRDQGYDVRTTAVRDFRGRRRTYNGHLGTDFVVPIGTPVVAPAGGVVVRVENLMHRGGLKVMIDHGEGLVTICNHLARASVEVGEHVARGDRIGLSGFSSVDGILFFPWVPPHVHMTVLLDGEPVDPFAAPGEASIWREGNTPRGVPERAAPDEAFVEDTFDIDALDDAIAACRDRALRDTLDRTRDLRARAFALLSARFFGYALFTYHPQIYRDRHERRPRLDLPLRREHAHALHL